MPSKRVLARAKVARRGGGFEVGETIEGKLTSEMVEAIESYKTERPSENLGRNFRLVIHQDDFRWHYGMDFRWREGSPGTAIFYRK